jgi:CheY-like chemotaxis protein
MQSIILKLTEKNRQGLAPFQIMLVEDDKAACEIIEFFLRTLGNFSVASFHDAEKALSALEENPQFFDAIITDIRMPRFDGKMFIEAIRLHEKLKEKPVIALTAYGTTDVLLDCLRLGASGFLVKPPNKSDLLRELARAQRIKNGQIPARLVVGQEKRALEEYFAKQSS